MTGQWIENKPVDPRDPSKELPDGTRRMMMPGMGETGLWFFPDATAWLSDGLELHKGDDVYVIVFRGDVIVEFPKPVMPADEEALDRLLSA